MEPAPEVGGPPKRGSDQVVPDWDEAGALTRQQLPRSNPSDVVLGVQELPHLVGFPSVLHQRPCASGPEVDVWRNPAESVTYLSAEFPLEQVDRDLNGDRDAETLHGEQVSGRKPVAVVLAITAQSERLESSTGEEGRARWRPDAEVCA